MCGMCPDCVEICSEGVCGERSYTGFYLGGGDMCDHLFEKYGTRNASLLYHVRRDHDPDDNFGRFVHTCVDDCINKNWWPGEDVNWVTFKAHHDI